VAVLRDRDVGFFARLAAGFFARLAAGFFARLAGLRVLLEGFLEPPDVAAM